MRTGPSISSRTASAIMLHAMQMVRSPTRFLSPSPASGGSSDRDRSIPSCRKRAAPVGNFASAFCRGAASGQSPQDQVRGARTAGARLTAERAQARLEGPTSASGCSTRVPKHRTPTPPLPLDVDAILRAQDGAQRHLREDADFWTVTSLQTSFGVLALSIGPSRRRLRG